MLPPHGVWVTEATINVEPRQREGAVWYAARAPCFCYCNDIYAVIVFYHIYFVQFSRQYCGRGVFVLIIVARSHLFVCLFVCLFV